VGNRGGAPGWRRIVGDELPDQGNRERFGERKTRF